MDLLRSQAEEPLTFSEEKLKKKLQEYSGFLPSSPTVFYADRPDSAESTQTSLYSMLSYSQESPPLVLPPRWTMAAQIRG